MVLYILGVNLWSQYAPSILKPNINYRVASFGHTYSRLLEVKDYGEVDILFLGSSLAYRGFDGRIFAEEAYRSFNLGTSAQTPSQSIVLLKRYLDLLNPALIVYELNPSTVASDGVESSCDIIANDINDWESVKMAWELDHIKTFNTLVVGFVRDALGLNSGISEARTKGVDTNVSGGFVQRELSFSQTKDLGKKRWAFRDYQLKNIIEISKMANEKEIELIFVFPPISQNLYRRLEHVTVFDSVILSLGNYYNFNKIMALDDSLHFFDLSHLNQNGVKRFNREFLHILKRD